MTDFPLGLIVSITWRIQAVLLELLEPVESLRLCPECKNEKRWFMVFIFLGLFYFFWFNLFFFGVIRDRVSINLFYLLGWFELQGLWYLVLLCRKS